MKSEQSPDSTGSIPQFQSRKSRVGLILSAFGLLVAGGIGLAFFLDHRSTKKKTARIDQGWSNLSQCLVGDLGKEAPSARFRRIQLGAMGLDKAARSTPGEGDPWPTRCYQHAFELDNALKDARVEQKDGGELATASRELAELLRSGPDVLYADLTAKIDKLWALASKEAVRFVASTVPAPPGGATPLSWEELPKVPYDETTFRFMQVSPHRSEVFRFLLAPVGSSPRLCELSLDGRELGCKALSGPAGNDAGHHLLGTEDTGLGPTVFVGRRGLGGVFAEKGPTKSYQKMTNLYSYGSTLSKDGNFAALGFNLEKKELVLFRHLADGTSDSTVPKPPGEIPNYYYGSQLLWGSLFWKAVNAEDQVHLYEQPISFGKELIGLDPPPRKEIVADKPEDILKLPTGRMPDPIDKSAIKKPIEKVMGYLLPAVDIGLLDDSTHAGGDGDDEPAAIEGCRYDKTVVVRTRGWPTESIAMKGPAGFRPPVKVFRGGGTLSCGNETATLSRAATRDDDGRTRLDVDITKCTATTCIPFFSSFALETPVVPRGQKERKAQVRGGVVGGKAIVVWLGSERNGVRIRLGEPAKLAEKPDIVLVDDVLGKTGKIEPQSGVYAVNLTSHEGFAIVWLITRGGLAAIRISADGTSEAVRVR